MNRLVIVGNGFDIVHGLETKYEHFLKDYLIKHIKSLEINPDEISDDKLITVKYYSHYRTVGGKKIINLFDDFSLNQLLESEYLSIQNKWKKSSNGWNYGITAEREQNCFISIIIKSRLFGELISERKWTDIEKTYFDTLLEVFAEEKTNKSKRYTINDLNKDFDFLKAKIIDYLNEVNESIPTNFNYSGVLHKCFDIPEQKYFKRYISNGNYENNKKIDNIFFVNFNYTKLLELCIAKLKGVNPDVNVKYFPIHGSLNNPETIVFGYGDDSNKHYQDLEDEDNEEYLKNIKSFYYPNDSHYIDLINALYEQEFDVFVFGHSLGLSDRVLLKTIFEHDNCKAIKLFHRGSKESQFSKRIALSRHFTDKIKMRSKIVGYSEEDKMQISPYEA